MPVAILPDTYFELRHRVAEQFHVHPNEVIVVGSCRLGFSIKRNARYRAVRSSSDVDLSVVSAEIFDLYWDAVFKVSRADMVWKNSDLAKRFKTSLFRGWIEPRHLPSHPSFAIGQEWTEFFDQLVRSRICGLRGITARLYRTWDRLEAYQEIMISECRREFERIEHVSDQ